MAQKTFSGVPSDSKCECADWNCPAHKGHSDCREVATSILYRVDMQDETGTAFCDACAEDAMESGLFTDSLDDDSDVDVDDDSTDSEIDWLKTGPEKLFLYVKHPKATNAVGEPTGYPIRDYLYHVTTWLGTTVSEWCKVGERVRSGFGFHTYRRSVACVIFGTRYVGWYFESSGNYCRLRKAKRQK